MATSILTGSTQARASLAGAVTFDAAMQRIGAASAESFDRNGAEDYYAMVAVLDKALQTAMDQGPEFRFGFLLPLVELIDSRRLSNEGQPSPWSGVLALKRSSDQQASQMEREEARA